MSQFRIALVRDMEIFDSLPVDVRRALNEIPGIDSMTVKTALHDARRTLPEEKAVAAIVKAIHQAHEAHQ